MLRDITIGQFFPGESIIHRIDPRFKIIITLLFIVMLFAGDSVWCLGIGTLFTVMSLILSKIPIKMFVKSIKPLLPFLMINISVFMIIRIVLLIAGSSLLTYTTSPITLTDAIERLLSPLKKLKFPVHELAMMMSIALRFIPTLIEETDKIMSAQKARGAEIDSGSLLTRAKNLISIMIPLFISAFRRADELATAMECRCYNGGSGRTRLRQMKSSAKDYAALMITVLFLAAVISADKLLPGILK